MRLLLLIVQILVVSYTLESCRWIDSVWNYMVLCVSPKLWYTYKTVMCEKANNCNHPRRNGWSVTNTCLQCNRLW